MKKIVAAAVLLATPAYAGNGNGNGNGNGTGGPDAYSATAVLHSYSSNPLDKEVGLCGPAPHFTQLWRPCFWN